MNSRYVHFSARNLEDAALELHEFRSKEHAETVLKQIKCERCNELNPPERVRCTKCSFILDKELTPEARNRREKGT